MKKLKKKIKKYSFILFAITALLLLGCALWLTGTQFIWIPLFAFVTLFLSVTPKGRRSLTSFEAPVLLPSIGIPMTLGIVSSIYQFWNTTVLPKMTLGVLLFSILIPTLIAFVLFLVIKSWWKDIKSYRIKKRIEIRDAKRKKEKEQRLHEEQVKKEGILYAISLKGGIPEWSDVLALVACKGLTDEDWKCIVYACQCLSPKELLTISTIKKTIREKDDFISVLKVYEIVFTRSSDDEVLRNIQIQFGHFVSEITDRCSSFDGSKKVLDEIIEHCPQLFADICNMHMEPA